MITLEIAPTEIRVERGDGVVAVLRMPTALEHGQFQGRAIGKDGAEFAAVVFSYMDLLYLRAEGVEFADGSPVHLRHLGSTFYWKCEREVAGAVGKSAGLKELPSTAS